MACSKPAAIQHLPAELLLSILVYLPPLDKTSLALTCRALAFILGSHVSEVASKAKGASWRQHDEFLDLLQRDLDDEKYWRCRDCLTFHLRSRPPPEQKPKPLLAQRLSLRGFFNCGKSPEEADLRLGILGDPLYVLRFNLIRAVMDRHFLGAPHGVCLNSMKCSGTRVFPVFGISNMVLRYDVTPKIVLDRLLLRATYTFSPQRTMYVQNMRVHEISVNGFLDTISFMFCGHQHVRNMTQVHDLKDRTLRCSYCPTQHILTMPTHDTVCFRVYQNLGSGRSPLDARWKHFVQPWGKGTKQYPWGGEDVMEAFERILCSTREEFERQLQKSDGLGNWYDPALKRRTYKTLPKSVARAL